MAQVVIPKPLGSLVVAWLAEMSRVAVLLVRFSVPPPHFLTCHKHLIFCLAWPFHHINVKIPHLAHYNMPHFAQPNFGPIAPPSQTLTGFTTPGRGRRNTNIGADTATAATRSPIEDTINENPSALNSGVGGHRRTGAGGLPLRGAQSSAAASSEDTEFSHQSTDEMGNVSGVKL